MMKVPNEPGLSPSNGLGLGVNRATRFCRCSLCKDLFVQFTADVLVLDFSLCQASALQLALI